MTLDALTARRRKWVEANKENGFDEGIKRLLTELYPDNAHFIYELLQNAEDPGANTVRFTLSDTNLEFEHDAPRLFSLSDVDSITSIGVSTKRDDPTSIGKFGVGFKAVFAYTETPEIHSGEFHFRIRDLVVPETDKISRPRMKKNETRFVFPFDHPKKRTKQAIDEIRRGLEALKDNTLLFLKHISVIEYILPDGSLGTLERIEHDENHVEIRAQHPGRGKAVDVSHWLRFEKEVKVTDEIGKTKKCRIAIAFRLEKEGEAQSGQEWKVVPLDRGEVSIYFPADKETSNLRFHIHAPFASTVARDSVRDCEANDELRNHMGDLVVDALAIIRDQGLLNVGFLSVLPNPLDGIPDFYDPIRLQIVEAFQVDQLTPTKSGEHAPSSSLYRGPARISELITDEDLAMFLDKPPPLWAANSPQQNQRGDKFIESLDIDDWSWHELSSAMSPWDDDERVLLEDWVKTKSDQWIFRFYVLMNEGADTHYFSPSLDATHFIRVETDDPDNPIHVVPKEAFFPAEEDTRLPSDIQVVKKTTLAPSRASDNQKRAAKSFLTSIGVREYDAKAVIERKLERYKTKEPISLDKDYFRDIKQFVQHWRKNPSDIQLFSRIRVIVGEDEVGRLSRDYAESLFLDDPYVVTGLKELKDIHKKRSLWSGYLEEFKDKILVDFIEFTKALGIFHYLKVSKASIWSNPHKPWRGYGSTRETSSGIHVDYYIDHLPEFLRLQSIAASRLIWEALIKADNSVSHAKYRPNQQYQTQVVESQLVFQLRQCEWIPDKQGVFHSPQEISRTELRDDFPYDARNGVLEAIGFGENARLQSEEYVARSKMAKEIGFDSLEEAEETSHLLKELKNDGVTNNDLIAYAAQRRQVTQPEQSAPNPERRKRGVRERRENAPDKASVKRERSIILGSKDEAAEARAYLRTKYTNEDGELICQCCRGVMPFKINGLYYFEAVQCVKQQNKHHFENRLALCPTCSAKYQYARHTQDDDLVERIRTYAWSETDPFIELQVELAGRNEVLRFVGTHFLDLQTVFALDEDPSFSK